MDYYNLFKDVVRGFKETGNGQFVGLCPIHNDNKQSFSGNVDTGLWNCFACGKSGNAYQIAEELGLENPKQFINGTSTIYEPKPAKVVKVDSNMLNQKMKQFRFNLKSNSHSNFYNYVWNPELIDDINIGLQKDILKFGYTDVNGKLTAIKTHKKSVEGNGKSQWYPMHKIAEYSPQKPIDIMEGEIDTITALSMQLQGITGTTGANSIPKDSKGFYDVNWLDKFDEIIICYDNDKAGRKGSKKLADEIHRNLPFKSISIIQWDKDFPDNFDFTDSFQTNEGREFYDAKKNRIYPFKDRVNIGGFKLITGQDATDTQVEPQRQIIDNLLPENAQIVVAGTTNSNKSFFGMQMGMSLANDEAEFLGFKINVKGVKILYADTECGKPRLIRRFQDIKKNMNFKGASRFNMISQTGIAGEDVYDTIEQYIIQTNPDVVFIDCLYNTTGGKDISKNQYLFDILQKITYLKEQYGVTIVLIAHFNKGGHSEGLMIDRMSGGSALQNWVEHCILLTKTNDSAIRLMKIDKSRDIGYPDCYYEIEWIGDKCWLINNGISMMWKTLLIGEDSKIKWANALELMGDEFGTGEFQTAVAEGGDASDRTANNWLRKMVEAGVIERCKQGVYRKKLNIINDKE